MSDSPLQPYPFADLSPPYSLIYADCPWQFNDSANAGKRGAVHKYPVMSVEDICALPVGDLAAKDCLLALWWVGAMPEEALAVVKAWGFTLKTMKGFTWHKLTKNGKDAYGMGHYTRANTEDCLFAIRGKRFRADAGVPQLIHAEIGRHSEKPEEARARLERLCGDVKRVELFSRGRYKGWDVWGNDVPDAQPEPIETTTIPVIPPEGLLESMAIRLDHTFGVSHGMTDEQIEFARNSPDVVEAMEARQHMTSQERAARLGQMAQVHKEVVGKGFYRYE